MFTILRFWPQTISTFLSVVEGQREGAEGAGQTESRDNADDALMMITAQ